MDDVFAGRFETGREPWAGGWKDRGDPADIRKTDNAHWANRTLRQLALNETIGAMAARLMDTPEVRLWHDQLLYKPGQGVAARSAAGNVGWHQDHGYWRCTGPDLITAWVAFDDVNLDNGCMQVVPGSQEWGLLSRGDFFDTDLGTMASRIQQLTGQPFQPVPCTLRAGEGSFHHCLTVHGSGPNVTDKPRRSLVLHLMPAHAAYQAGSPDDNHMNAILMRQGGGQDGELFQGEPWPTVYRRDGLPT
jgi:ectoine hydroxylase-related dioxygenase (phytanoyl-CoA dioxygenase family)